MRNLGHQLTVNLAIEVNCRDSVSCVLEVFGNHVEYPQFALVSAAARKRGPGFVRRFRHEKDEV